MRRMDKIRDIDTASNTMTCEAGVVLQIAQQRAAEVDRLFPLSLGAEGSCTIGGNLSTNAGGTAALAYGVAREMALGLEVVLADGRILNVLSKLKKDNTGYDLQQPLHRRRRHARHRHRGDAETVSEAARGGNRLCRPQIAGRSAEAAARSRRTRPRGTLTSFELLADIAVDFSVRHGIDIRHPLASRHPWYVLMELSSPRDDARATLEAILAKRP